jgi:hypothetical protein
MTPNARPLANGRLGQSPFTSSSNILCRVLSRSLTGRRLGLQVHNHLGHRLHVLWIARTGKGSSGSLVQCFQRRYMFSSDMENVRKQMATRPMEGVCTCMWDNLPWNLLIQRRVIHCARMPPMETGVGDACPASWTRELVEMDEVSKCSCPITSSALMDVEPSCGYLTIRQHYYLSPV